MLGQNETMNETELHDVTIRRAPRVGMFITTGAALGFVVTVVVTLFFPADPTVGMPWTFEPDAPTALPGWWLSHGLDHEESAA